MESADIISPFTLRHNSTPTDVLPTPVGPAIITTDGNDALVTTKPQINHSFVFCMSSIYKFVLHVPLNQEIFHLPLKTNTETSTKKGRYYGMERINTKIERSKERNPPKSEVSLT
jgi:hypothetical protein